MKVLLIQPPVQDFYQTAIRTQPIGLAYLAASLKKKGFEAEILNCQTEKRKSMPIPPELSYLKDFYPFHDRGPFKLYTGYYHFGMEWEEIGQRIMNSKADAFGISSSFTPFHGEALKIAEMIKNWNPRKIVVMGGAHVSCDPEHVLKSPFVDFAILGEGEVRFPPLLEEIERGGLKKIDGIDGIGYRRYGEIRIRPVQQFIRDPDFLPHPERAKLDLDRYRIGKRRSTMIITSRGCPHGCAYCSAHLVMGPVFRPRSSEDVLKEMLECRKEYGIEIFDIEDDNFTFDQVRAKKLMNLIVENFGEGTLHLSAMNGVSYASLDEELLRLMKRAGFHTINLSLVSIDPFTRERMRRPEPTAEFDKILDHAEQNNLDVVAYAILGMPGQKIEEMVTTLIALSSRRVLIGPSVYYPTPGTPLFRQCEREGILPPHFVQWRSTAFPIETEEFNRLDILTLFRLARVINFIKGKIDGGELDEGIIWEELVARLKEKPEGENGSAPWMDLLLLLFQERSFFALTRQSGGVSFVKEETSKRVLDCFFEKAWRSPVLKSRSIKS